MNLRKHILDTLAGVAVLLTATACSGVFDGIYDEVPATPTVTEGQLLVDATSWKDWYYVDFDSLRTYIEQKDTAGLLKAQTHFAHFPIPTTLSGGAGDGQTGIYTYWFDVFGKGISVNEKRSFTPADAQEEPPSWSIADQSQMLQSLIGCQGIKINKVLSNWLRLDIPPMPPAFTMNSHVFIIRMKNGNYAAVQLENYMNAEGAKCWLTINYKYPY